MATIQFTCFFFVPVHSNQHNVEQGDAKVGIKEEGENFAEQVAKNPGLVDEPRRRQRKVEHAKQHVRDAQAHDKPCGCMAA